MADISLVTGSIDIGDATFSKTTPVGSGTGLYDPFLATHDSNANGQTNDGVAEGFNNDATGILDVDASKTSSLKLSDMPIKVIDGVEYYEFRVDLNETNNVAGRIVTLNEFKIYTSTSPATLANFNNTTDEFGAGFTKVYDLDAGEDRTLILRDDNSGSGTDDYSVLIKVSAFGDVDPTTTYLTLYTNMGRQPGAAEDGGFEEWKTEDVAASITGTKFEDLNGNTVQDPGEGGLGGVTIFLDRDQDGTLDAGERTTVTADDGSYTFFGVGQTEFGSDNVLWIDEVTPDGYTQTTGAHETLTWAGEIPYTVDPIGNQPPAPPPTPAIAIDKVFLNVSGGDGDALADAVGDVLHYTVTVTNTGNVTLTGVTVVDPLTGQNISGVTLAPGANQTFNTSYTLTQADLDGAGHAGGDHDIDNTATASSNETGETQASSTVEVPLVYDPKIAIDKVFLNVSGGDGDAFADAVGDVLHYTVTVTNTGNVTLTGVTVVDPLTGQNISGVTLAPGANQTFNTSYTLTQADLDGAGHAGGDHDIDNTATASSNETGETQASSTVEVPLVYDPKIAIDKVFLNVSGGDGDALADAVGDVLNYTVQVTNTGNVTLTGVTVVDPLTGQNISGVTLAPGANQTFNTSYTLTQADLDGAGHAGGDHDIDNTATASSNETGETQASSTVEVPLVYDPKIAIDKVFLNVSGGDGDALADAVGDVLNYTVQVTNTGNVTLTGVTVVDPLTGQNISGVTLAPGANQIFNTSYTLTQADLDGAGHAGGDHDIDNTATASSNETGETQASSTVEVPLVLRLRAIAIDKVFLNVSGGDGDALADAVGDVLNYTVQVTNTGNVTLTGVTVVDPLTGQNISGVTLAPGANQIFNTSYTLTQADLDGAGHAGGDHDIDNTATASSNETGETQASSTVEVPLVYNPALAIDKEFVNVNGNVGEQADSVGDVLNYAVTVTNTGNVTLTGVTVVDPLTGQNISGVTLAPGASQVFNSAYAITQDDLDGAGNAGSDHDIDNTATAASSQTGEQHATASVEVPLVYDPNLAIEKEFENVNGNPGEQANSVGDVINYRVTVENTGNVTLTGVSVVDPLTGQNVSGIVLAPGESQSFESSYTITQDDLNGAGNAGADHDIDNVATANSDQTGPGDSNTVEVPLTPEVVVRAFDGEPRPTWSHDHNSDIIWQDFAGGLGRPADAHGRRHGHVTPCAVQPVADRRASLLEDARRRRLQRRRPKRDHLAARLQQSRVAVDHERNRRAACRAVGLGRSASGRRAAGLPVRSVRLRHQGDRRHQRRRPRRRDLAADQRRRDAVDDGRRQQHRQRHRQGGTARVRCARGLARQGQRRLQW